MIPIPPASTGTPTAPALYLGPAEVVSPAAPGGPIEVRLLDGEIALARLALTLPYDPAPGDEVLVVCQRPPEAYVIGVLQGRGLTRLRVPGDLQIEAPRGSIRLQAGHAIELHSDASVGIQAPTATLRARRINLLATSLVQKVEQAFTWARDLIQLKSRRVRTVADEGWLVRARRAHVKTSGNTVINGETIHLG